MAIAPVQSVMWSKRSVAQELRRAKGRSPLALPERRSDRADTTMILKAPVAIPRTFKISQFMAFAAVVALTLTLYKRNGIWFMFFSLSCVIIVLVGQLTTYWYQK